MSALVAFTGPKSPELLRRMSEQLRHRGSVVGSVEWESASAATLEWPEQPPLGEIQTQCRVTPDCADAFAGFGFASLPVCSENLEQLRDLRGSYAFCRIRGRGLHIARDMSGCQSLYYAEIDDPPHGKRWVVASEPKAITTQLGFRKELRPASLAQYLAFSFVPGRNTMLRDLYEVEAGTSVRLQPDEAPTITRIFDFEAEESSIREISEGETIEWAGRIRQCIHDSVAERLCERDPVVFLSGGLDSSIVAAEVAKQAKGKVQTFAVHFGTEYQNELPFARQVADRIGSKHTEVLIRPKEFLPNLRRMIWHLDEPIGDPITQPNFELARRVSGQGRFVFNGEGGDPLFGGPKNLPMMLTHWYGIPNRPPNFRHQAYLASYRRAYEEWDRLIGDATRGQIDPARDLEGPLTPFFAPDGPRNFLNKLMAINIRLKGANLILPKVDRMLAAHGLTPLSPLFESRLTELSFAMPPGLKLRHGVEKFILKQAYQDALPSAIIDRPKSGMRVPVHYWFQKDLRRIARRLLSRRAVVEAGIFDPARIEQLLSYATEEGPGRYGLRLWMLITFELWRRIVVEGESV